MNFQVRELGDVFIVSPQGRLDMAMVPSFETALTQLVGERVKFIFNMQDVPYISSAGIRLILSFHKSLMERNGKLMICCVPEAIEGIMKLSGIDQILPFYESEKDCLTRM